MSTHCFRDFNNLLRRFNNWHRENMKKISTWHQKNMETLTTWHQKNMEILTTWHTNNMIKFGRFLQKTRIVSSYNIDHHHQQVITRV